MAEPKVDEYRLLFPLAGVALLAALLPWPYVYYQLLRLLVVGVCAYGAMLGLRTHRLGWTWTFALVAAPFIVLRADRATWALLDMAAAAIIVIGGRALTRQTRNPSS